MTFRVLFWRYFRSIYHLQRYRLHFRSYSRSYSHLNSHSNGHFLQCHSSQCRWCVCIWYHHSYRLYRSCDCLSLRPRGAHVFSFFARKLCSRNRRTEPAWTNSGESWSQPATSGIHNPRGTTTKANASLSRRIEPVNNQYSNIKSSDDTQIRT